MFAIPLLKNTVSKQKFVKTVESRSGVFMVNFKHISHFFSVSFVDFQ